MKLLPVTATRSDCPECGESTYGAIDTYSPSGRRFHRWDCTVPDRCPSCGARKRRGFAQCRRCEHIDRLERADEAKRQWGIEERERAILSGGPLVIECVVCHKPDGVGQPLGLYGPNRATSHYDCLPVEEAM